MTTISYCLSPLEDLSVLDIKYGRQMLKFFVKMG